MLVLSRKRDTAVRIGPNIEVRVLSIRNGQVKLGIDAPNGVPIWRDEID
ncbi:MAG: carbon storage regulator [bacterium]|nr:carbon storage regulator [bacterium]